MSPVYSAARNGEPGCNCYVSVNFYGKILQGPLDSQGGMWYICGKGCKCFEISVYVWILARV